MKNIKLPSHSTDYEDDYNRNSSMVEEERKITPLTITRVIKICELAMKTMKEESSNKA